MNEDVLSSRPSHPGGHQTDEGACAPRPFGVHATNLEAAKTASIEHTKPKEFQSHVSAIPTTVRPQALPFRCSVSLIPALCSRQAIISSNATSDFNYIGFDIPGSGVQTIDLLSALPTLTQPVTIDGTSQPGYGSQPLIQIDGSKAGSGVVGLDVASAASGSSFHGLSITDFSGGGMLVNGASNVSIVNDDIGLVQDSTGVVVHGNGVFGVEFENGASNNGLGNDVISGQAGNGVVFAGPGTSNNLLEDSQIGTDPTGSTGVDSANNSLANAWSGVAIASGASDNTVSGDVLSNNGSYGVYIVRPGHHGQRGRRELHRHRRDRLVPPAQLRRGDHPERCGRQPHRRHHDRDRRRDLGQQLGRCPHQRQRDGRQRGRGR